MRVYSAICCPSDCTAGRQAEIGYSSFCQECLQRFCQLCSYISFFRIHLIRDHALLDPPAGNKNTMSSLLQVSCCSWQKWLSPPQANLFIRIRPCYKPTCRIKKLFSSSHKIPAFRIRVLLSRTGSAKKSQSGSGSMEKTPKNVNTSTNKKKLFIIMTFSILNTVLFGQVPPKPNQRISFTVRSHQFVKANIRRIRVFKVQIRIGGKNSDPSGSEILQKPVQHLRQKKVGQY